MNSNNSSQGMKKIRILESKLHDMTGVMATIVEVLKDQRTSGVHTEVLNSTTNNSLISIPDDIRRNELDFRIGCTTSQRENKAVTPLKFVL